MKTLSLSEVKMKQSALVNKVRLTDEEAMIVSNLLIPVSRHNVRPYA